MLMLVIQTTKYLNGPTTPKHYELQV